MDADFPMLLKTYRKSMGWTQEEISQKWSYSFETISAWERGKRRPGSQEVPRLAKFLGVESEKLARIVMGNDINRENAITTYATEYGVGTDWKANYETWGELQHIYRTRTEFNKDFSYPRMFENCHSILATGISLNAIAMNYDRELIKQAIVEKNCFLQLCFLDPLGKHIAEREKEEKYNPGILTKLTDTNLVIINDLRNQIAKVDQEKCKFLEIRTYDMIPRFNIYIVDDRLMTVQGYAYGRGEETPTLALKRKMKGGLFDFYVSVAQHVLMYSVDINDKNFEGRQNSV